MNSLQVQLFLHLADKLNFSRTAEDMNLSQSAVSRQILLLEDELGFTLFDRTNRSVRLTDAAQLLKPELVRLKSEFETARRRAKLVSTGEAGSIRLGHISSIAYSWLPQLLADFSNQYPSVRLDLSEISGSEAEKRLLSFQLDIGFWREPSQNNELEYLAIYTEPFALVVPEAYPVKDGTFFPLDKLQHEPFILPAFCGENWYSKELQKLFREHNFTPRQTITSDFGATILQLVSRGLGVSVLPFSYAASPVKGVRFIKLVQQSSIYMSWRRDDPSIALKHFRQLATTMDYTFY